MESSSLLRVYRQILHKKRLIPILRLIQILKPSVTDEELGCQEIGIKDAIQRESFTYVNQDQIYFIYSIFILVIADLGSVSSRAAIELKE